MTQGQSSARLPTVTVDDEDALLLALGRLVVASGRLEHRTYMVAISLGVTDAPAVAVTKALDLARRRLVSDPPPWCTLQPPEFDAWRPRVVAALEQRNQVFHSMRVRRRTAGRWEPAHLRLRDGSDIIVAPDTITAITADLNAATESAPIRKVMPEVRPGVHMPVIQAEGYESGYWIFWDPVTQRYPDSPTDEEVAAWWPPVWRDLQDWVNRQTAPAPSGG